MAEYLGRRHPTLRARTLFLTGGAVTPSAEEFLARADVRHLDKPIRIGRLNEALKDLLETAAQTRP